MVSGSTGEKSTCMQQKVRVGEYDISVILKVVIFRDMIVRAAEAQIDALYRRSSRSHCKYVGNRNTPIAHVHLLAVKYFTASTHPRIDMTRDAHTIPAFVPCLSLFKLLRLTERALDTRFWRRSALAHQHAKHRDIWR